jgi:hypothetical protein
MVHRGAVKGVAYVVLVDLFSRPPKKCQRVVLFPNTPCQSRVARLWTPTKPTYPTQRAATNAWARPDLHLTLQRVPSTNYETMTEHMAEYVMGGWDPRLVDNPFVRSALDAVFEHGIGNDDFGLIQLMRSKEPMLSQYNCERALVERATAGVGGIPPRVPGRGYGIGRSQRSTRGRRMSHPLIAPPGQHTAAIFSRSPPPWCSPGSSRGR